MCQKEFAYSGGTSTLSRHLQTVHANIDPLLHRIRNRRRRSLRRSRRPLFQQKVPQRSSRKGRFFADKVHRHQHAADLSRWRRGFQRVRSFLGAGLPGSVPANILRPSRWVEDRTRERSQDRAGIGVVRGRHYRHLDEHRQQALHQPNCIIHHSRLATYLPDAHQQAYWRTAYTGMATG